jgi:hypothetical protein
MYFLMMKVIPVIVISSYYLLLVPIYVNIIMFARYPLYLYFRPKVHFKVF